MSLYLVRLRHDMVAIIDPCKRWLGTGRPVVRDGGCIEVAYLIGGEAMDKGFGERLVALRQGRGYSQEQIAMRLGVTRQRRAPA